MKKTLLSISILTTASLGFCQELLSPSFSFSHKKTAYITLDTGKEIKGNIKDIDRDKGLIEEIKIINGKGKKLKLKPEDIKFMYLPPSGIDKLGNAMNTLTDTQKWNDQKLNQDLLSQGYVYFENSAVKIKKREEVLLMQLLNPDFSKVVKVYHDPKAKETTAIGIGGLDVAGGDIKSYYIKVNDEAAYKVKKKNYAEEFIPIYRSCKSIIENNPKPSWKDLTKHILELSECQATK